jgi:transcriptional regulator with XRE-family HTH domain
MELRARVAKNLRRLRHARGLTQDELGARAEVSGNYVGQLEREEKAATVDVLERLANVLSVDASEFFQRD